MSALEVAWHESISGLEGYYTRVLYLYINGRLSGFVAYAEGLGWSVFKFTTRQTPSHSSLLEAQIRLIELCQEE